jgi:hypothetical protein
MIFFNPDSELGAIITSSADETILHNALSWGCISKEAGDNTKLILLSGFGGKFREWDVE